MTNKNLLQLRPEASEKVCIIHVVHKLREEIDCLETGCFWPRAVPWRPVDLTPRPEITFTELDWSRYFHQDPFIPSKVIQLFNLDRHTDRHTQTHTDTHR